MRSWVRNEKGIWYDPVLPRSQFEPLPSSPDHARPQMAPSYWDRKKWDERRRRREKRARQKEARKNKGGLPNWEQQEQQQTQASQ